VERQGRARDRQLTRRNTIAVHTFFAYSGVYSTVEGALTDYHAVHDLQTEAGLIDASDAAVLERKPDGKVKIAKKHETPTRVGGVLGRGVGPATGLLVALFPAAAIGGGLLLATGGGGAALGGPGRARCCRHEPERGGTWPLTRGSTGVAQCAGSFVAPASRASAYGAEVLMIVALLVVGWREKPPHPIARQRIQTGKMRSLRKAPGTTRPLSAPVR